MSKMPKAALGGRIRPYRVASSGRPAEDVLAGINRAVFSAHGPDVKARGGVVGIMADTVAAYERLLARLRELPEVVITTMHDAVLQGRSDVMQCVVRHDIDVDIRTALTLAEVEQELGVRTSYYVLHTAPYYGEFRKDVFLRHEAMGAIYMELQQRGHEVGLHTDPLLCYQEHGMDGAQAIVEELRWLRELGLRITGTVAHNSVSTYGAANYAVFRGRPQSYAAAPQECPAEVVHDGRWAPLGVLDEADLGLEYEGNDLFWQRGRPVMYAVVSGIDHWWWEREKNIERLQADAAKTPRSSPEYIGTDELIVRIASAEPGTTVCLVVHPVYYGARHLADKGPPRRLARREVMHNETMGWFTYRPGSVQASYGQDGAVDERQAVNVANELGMLDLPLADVSAVGKRIVFVGGSNIDAATCNIEGHAHRWTERALLECGLQVRCEKLAHPDMGMARYAGWLDWLSGHLGPGTVVVLGIGSDEYHRSHVDGWSSLTGIHPRHPAGPYLARQGRETEIVVSSPGWELYRRPVGRAAARRDLPPWAPEVRDEIEGAVEWCISIVRERGFVPVLLVDECGEREGIWRLEQEGLSRLRDLHDRLESWLQALAARLDVPLIDPYPDMLALAADGRHCHWVSADQWNYRGQRLVGKLVAERLRRLLEGGGHTVEVGGIRA